MNEITPGSGDMAFRRPLPMPPAIKGRCLVALQNLWGVRSYAPQAPQASKNQVTPIGHPTGQNESLSNFFLSTKFDTKPILGTK